MTAVSCVLPVYNGAMYLEEAIQSVLGQTFTDFELIVVDDGSSDRTPQIIAEQAARDARIVSFRQDNAGIVPALNAGLHLSKGRYVARMDADDISLPHRFAAQVSHLDMNPDCVLVGGLAEGFSSEGLEGISSGGRHRQTDLNAFPPKVAVSVHPLIMVRREAIDRLGGYRSLFPHAEDYDLFLRLAAFGSVENPDNIILQYRRHSEAVSIRHLDMQERNAALAEACAIEEVQRGQAISGSADVEAIAAKIWPAWLLEPYVAFRIWRRIVNSAQRPTLWSHLSIVRSAFSINPPTLFSRRYFGLRIRILGSLFKSLKNR